MKYPNITITLLIIVISALAGALAGTYLKTKQREYNERIFTECIKHGSVEECYGLIKNN